MSMVAYATEAGACRHALLCRYLLDASPSHVALQTLASEWPLASDLASCLLHRQCRTFAHAATLKKRRHLPATTAATTAISRLHKRRLLLASMVQQVCACR
jgi:hypothetical protein